MKVKSVKMIRQSRIGLGSFGIIPTLTRDGSGEGPSEQGRRMGLALILALMQLNPQRRMYCISAKVTEHQCQVTE